MLEYMDQKNSKYGHFSHSEGLFFFSDHPVESPLSFPFSIYLR